MSFVIGLTGGIGSGKTAVSDHFQHLGIDVIDADVAARAVVEPGRPALQAIADHFGAGVLQADGSLDRAQLRQQVFSNPEERRWLEQLTHPMIREEIARGLAAARSPYCLLVSPLLVESGQKAFVRRILVVDVPEAVQLERTAARDNNSAEQVKAIMAAQASREQRLSYADDVISNDGSLAQLHARVEALHQQYLQLARQEGE